MRRLIKLLSPLIFAVLFISCAQSVKQDGSITFDAENLVSRVVQYSNYRSAEYGAGKREFNDEQKQAINDALKFNVLLSVEICDEHENYNDSAEAEFEGNYFGAPLFGPKEIKFDNVPVGNKVYITATVTSKLAIKDMDALASLATVCDMPAEVFLASNEEGFMEFLAEEFGWNFKCSGEAEHNVVAGGNQVPLKLKWVDSSTGEEGVEIGGNIETELPQKLTITINESRSASPLYRNKSTIYFSLIDEDGNDIAADPAYESTAGAIWEYEIRHGNTVISSPDYYIFQPGQLDVSNLPISGTYQLYVQATPLADGYVNCATTSATFDIDFRKTNYYEYDYEFDAANLIVENPYAVLTEEFTAFINSMTEDAIIKISGVTNQTYSNVFQLINNEIKNNAIRYSFLFNEMTTSNTSEHAKEATSVEFQDCYSLRSIVLPDDLISINSTFMGCSDLEEIIFGSCIQEIGQYAMRDCLNLSTVIIPEDAPLAYIDLFAFDGDAALTTLSLPENFVALGSEALGNIENLMLADESGTWYYTDDQTAWGKWYSHLLTPPEITNDALHSGLLEDLKDDVADFPEDGTVAEKLLFAAQNTSYYFYCVK